MNELTIPNARPCDTKYKGRQFYKFHVLISQSGVARQPWQCQRLIKDVIAEKPADAINWVRDNVPPLIEHYPCNWSTRGVKGGHTHRFAGWNTIIGEELFKARHEGTPYFTEGFGISTKN